MRRCRSSNHEGLQAARGAAGVLVSSLLAAALLSPSVCQCAPASERPRIGLVLSGGGARGAAHVGVLKVLEELRIPVDIVAGTSMGSVVGGLYACGLSPEEIERSLRQTDWDDVFDDSPPRRHLPFRMKRLDQVGLFDVELGVGQDGFRFPRGLVAGQKLDYILSTLTLHCAGVSDFDDLPIPFRAVATDLGTGERVVFRDQSIVTAMRASMAVPGAFTPVELDGRVLVDGGLVCNLPVDIVRSMGADVLVAVDISPSANDSGDGGSSAGDILLQSLYLLMDQNLHDQVDLLTGSDILLVPDLGAMSPAEFSDVGQAIDLGEKGAREALSELRRLSVGEEEYAAFLGAQRRTGAAPVSGGPVDAIRIEGMTRVDPRAIAGVTRIAVGQPLDAAALIDDLDRIYELGDFEAVGFHTSDTAEGHILTIDVKEKSWGPNFVRAGLSSYADLSGTADFTVRAHLAATRVNERGGELRTGLRFGSENGLTVELHQPLDYSGIFFASPRLDLEQRVVDSFADGIYGDEYSVRTLRGALDIGIQLRNHGEIRTGFFLGRRRATPRGEDLVESEVIGGYGGSATIDQLDNASFPMSGALARLEGRLFREDFGSDSRYETVSLDACSAFGFGENVFVVLIRGATSFDSVPPVYDRPALGGPLDLSAYEENRFRGSHLALGELVYYRRLMRLPSPLGTGLFVGASLETGDVWDARDEVTLKDLRHSASAFLGADTMAGPILLGWGFTMEGESSAFVSLGRPIVGD